MVYAAARLLCGWMWRNTAALSDEDALRDPFLERLYALRRIISRYSGLFVETLQHNVRNDPVTLGSC